MNYKFEGHDILQSESRHRQREQSSTAIAAQGRSSARNVPRLPILDLQAPTVEIDRAAEEVPSMFDRRPYLLTVSGRAAILQALLALDVRAGDRVLVPTYHCPTMIEPVARIGARPVFYPLDANGTERLDRIDAIGRGARVLLAAHYFGFPRRFDALAQWCRRHGVALMEDCAHAFFGHADGVPVGATGDVAIGSLTKFFAVEEGGCLVADGKVLSRVSLRRARGVDQLRGALDIVERAAEHGRLGSFNRIGRLALRAKRALRPGRVGSRESEQVADARVPAVLPSTGGDWARRPAVAVACAVRRPVDRSQTFVRRRHYARLAQRLQAVAGARPLWPELSAGAVPYVFPVYAEQPEALYLALRRLGVPVFRWDWRWPGVPSEEGEFGELWSNHILQIGCHQSITDEELEWIADTLLEQAAYSVQGARRPVN